MTSERRWLDENAPDDVRRLLQSAELDEPSAAQLDALRTRVAPMFDAPPPPPPPSSPAPAGALAGKIILGVALLALGGGVGLWFGSKTAPLSREGEGRGEGQPAAKPPAVAQPQPQPQPQPQSQPVVTAPKPKPIPKAVPAPASPPSEDEELAQLQAAMAAPTPQESLTLLEQHAQRFPNSTLQQEREVLTVKALMKLERADEARARADEFTRRWPTSPHLLRVEALVGK